MDKSKSTDNHLCNEFGVVDGDGPLVQQGEHAKRNELLHTKHKGAKNGAKKGAKKDTGGSSVFVGEVLKEKNGVKTATTFAIKLPSRIEMVYIFTKTKNAQVNKMWRKIYATFCLLENLRHILCTLRHILIT